MRGGTPGKEAVRVPSDAEAAGRIETFSQGIPCMPAAFSRCEGFRPAGGTILAKTKFFPGRSFESVP